MKIHILSAVLSLIFLASGVAKLASLEFEMAAFARWGYALWFMYVIGLLEVMGGIGLLLQRLAGLSCIGLALLMIGALATHLQHAEWGMLLVANILLLLTLVRVWQERVQLRTYLNRCCRN
ncbi:DoxX family protein [Vibrio cholerae]|uniref:DoxX family protein n=1 Tax=Vibrio cholerae TaxID=666 RepID=UPI0015CF034F|nr:DoxX family protein [Vibrio cholerae]EGR0793188.1 DoxX family protein [Vibrio cholerae]EGR0805249.1 DoxX family protein [Vibrio cholerae]EGR0811453.1 DoxX family protein [Vibrio cholerae]EGR0875385.1 DoxX family protein [Vibrio cholerae]EJE4211622.1 DoxX family protein [Vibrio cholerae]